MYYDWMMEHYLGKNTPRGDLAGDMRGALREAGHSVISAR